MAKSKIRIDQLLVERGLAESRTRAQALVMAGHVMLGDKKADKPGLQVAEDAEISVKGQDHPWVSRGGIKLAHALELHVTAEGVETAEQHEALRALGCDSMQGFLFARPMPGEAMRDRLLLDQRLDAAETAPSDWSTTMAAQLDMGLPTR